MKNIDITKKMDIKKELMSDSELIAISNKFNFDEETDLDSCSSSSDCGDLLYIDIEDDQSLNNIFIPCYTNKNLNYNNNSNVSSVNTILENAYTSCSNSSNSSNDSNQNSENSDTLNEILNNKTSDKLCSKCLLKKQASKSSSKIEIFNIVNDIIFSSTSMPEVHKKMDALIIKIDKWFEVNDDGLSVFHWFIWYISTKIKKYNHIKSKVYAFFQKVFSDNTIRTIFGMATINKIINLGTPKNPSHTILYHLVRYCENPNDVFYIRLYDLLLERGARQLTDYQLNEIKKLNSEEEDIPFQLKDKISSITDKYKHEENKIASDICENYPNCKLDKCVECCVLIDYTKEIPKIVKYAKENNCDTILTSMWSAYYQRKLVNTIFSKYYEKVNAQSNLNMIHKRHSHILNIYKECLESNKKQLPFGNDDYDKSFMNTSIRVR
jgi:hypothetical protein